MATRSEEKSQRMYSWWWDSHISPKNSRWLQENLTDMDSKVKSMIKLIEEDADSFARRAEMYYKKRPELMKLVEEFYRAYRALAERYDHATGALRQAHRTMSEVFPNQIPSLLPDDAPRSSASEPNPRTPETSTPVCAFLDLDDLQKDALGLSASHSHAAKKNGAFAEESDSVKQLNGLYGSGDHANFAEGRVRKSLNFHETVESEQVGKYEKEIRILKEAIAKLEAEKEAGLNQYQQSLESLSKLEAAVSHHQEYSREFSKQASKAEAETQALKETLLSIEAEKEASLLQYQQCLDKLSNLEDMLSHVQKDSEDHDERANKAETEAQTLKQDLAKVEAEKDAVINQHKQSLEMTSDLENKLLLAEESVLKYSEYAEMAEGEVKTLKLAISKLTEEKEAAALQYQQCLETISSLELKISSAHEEIQRLHGEIDSGVAKLKGAVERCDLLQTSNQSLHSELETKVLELGTQSRELTEKQELGRLWTCIQEERLRFMEAETAFQTLQCLHSHAQEELRSLASELQNRAQILWNMENHNKSLLDEILQVKEENKSMSELNLSSSMAMKGIQNKIFSLRETNGKLEEEVLLRVDQRNALQQEIYCLKEELKDLNNKHHAVLKQVDAVGLNHECFETSVKELQDENSNLRDSCQKERSEKVALLEKLEIFEKLLEKNALLENSLSDLGAELEAVRGKINVLEELCQSLLQEKSTLVDEKATLMTQLQITTENLEKLSETNSILENSLSNAHDELELLKAKAKSLEDSCMLLVNEKSGLVSEKETLVSQIEMTWQRLKDLEKRFTELEEKYSALEKEKNFTLGEVEELKVYLEVQKQEHVSSAQMSVAELAGLEAQVHVLKEESWNRNRELEGELDKAMHSQMEILVLQRCVQELGERNSSILFECQKLLEASILSEKLISELEQENLEQQLEVKSLFDQRTTLRSGMYQLLKAFNIVPEHGCDDKNVQDKTCVDHILRKFQEIKSSLFEAQDENQLLAIEMSVLITLLDQLRLKAANTEMEKSISDRELCIMSEKCLMVQSEAQKLSELTEKLKLEVIDGNHKEEELMTQIENLRERLLDMEGAYENSQEEKAQVLEEKRVLMKELLRLKEKNHTVEEENRAIFSEIVSLSHLSLIYEKYVTERSTDMKELGEDLNKLHGVNASLEKKMSITEKKLEDLQMENLHLKETLQKSEDELKGVTFVVGQLNLEIANVKNLFHRKEMELLEAEKKVSVKEDEKSGLSKKVEDLKREYDAVQMIREDLEKQRVKLWEDNDHLSKENECLGEASRNLDVELCHLHDKYEMTKNREESLCSEMQQRNDEIDIWETHATAFYGELQTFTIGQTLFEEKVYELIEERKSLQDENTLQDMKIELLDKRTGILEGQNEELKAQLASYGPAVTSLMDSISSLEKHTYTTNLKNTINEEVKEVELANHLHAESRPSEDQNSMVPDAFLTMQDLQTRVRVIENTIMEMERFAMHENSNAYTTLESAMSQIEELRSENRSLRGNVKPTSEISEEEESGLLPKDIMLDHVSETSSYGINKRRDYVVADNQMLELWETTDQDSSIDLTVGKGKKVVGAATKKERFEAVKSVKSEYSSDFLVEKELGVDKLEISKRFTEPRQEGNKRKVLERLNSDVQKLTNLQITVQDLKRKVEIIEKSRKTKPTTESDVTMKQKLEEAEAVIQKLFDLNGKLMKNIEDNLALSGKKSAMESEESGSVRRKRISEQARRVSEKIGRLQLEMQRIQFDLLKLDDEKESEGKSRITESKRRILLRDYLHGGVSKIPRRKKAPFCACIEPPTKGD